MRLGSVNTPRWRSLSVLGGMTPNGPGLALRIFQREKLIMPTGVLKWFKPTIGYGFIVPRLGSAGRGNKRVGPPWQHLHIR